MTKLKQALLAVVFGITSVAGGTAVAQDLLSPGSFVTPVNDNGDLWFDENAALATTSTVLVESTAVGGPNFTAGVKSWVYAGNPSNPFDDPMTGAIEGLTFVYQFTSDAGSDHAIERMTVNGFAGYDTAVAVSGALGGYTNLQDVATRSADGNVVGSTWFTSPVGAGDTGFLIVYTNATSYGQNQIFLQNGGQGDSLVLVPVPEPEIYAMMAAGLGLMGFVARRRKQREMA